jgi:hypothetical protein
MRDRFVFSGETDSTTDRQLQRVFKTWHCFVNRSIKLWNQLPAEALATFPCISHSFKKRVRKVILSGVKGFAS